MQNAIFKFNNTSYKKLYYGENCFSKALNEIITEQQFKSIFYISTNSLENTKQYEQIKASIQTNLVGEFPKSQAHNPITVVKQALTSIKNASSLNVIIAFVVVQ